ncbi:CutC family protein [Lasiosphaeria hispida]|uniref:Copper homeostasis protein cutC homolog n=1 Tax=Lasiosphaeria hispida TaxID=260671 RepID=A0AAJ0HQ10_9PEZI|nr:CutC family protein [Lasiosphaeria hispida]
MPSSEPSHYSQLEVPIFGGEWTSVVAQRGARRIELNATKSYAVGGTTPTIKELEFLNLQLKAHPQIVQRVMIRPRGPPTQNTEGLDPDPDFLYSKDEFAEMHQSIVTFKQSGLLNPEKGDGFVFGLLKKGHSGDSGVHIDVERNAALVTLAKPFRCVLHRAFDELIDQGAESSWKTELETVKSLGFDGILTSGGRGNAYDNAERLGQIIASAGGQIEIIVGGGVRSGNVREISTRMEVADSTVWFHSSCLRNGGGIMSFDQNEEAQLYRELEALGARN